MDEKNIDNEAEKAEVEENNQSESPTEEGNIQEAEPVAEESTEEPKAEPKAESKKSASYRVKQVLKDRDIAEEKAAKSEEKVKSLEDRIAELTDQAESGGENQYGPQASENSEPEPLIREGEDSIDPMELERRLKSRDDRNFQRTAAFIELKNRQERNLERINKEAQTSVKKHPELDPDREEFDKDLSDTVYEAVEAYVKSNPTGSVTEFVDKLIKPYKRSIEQEVGKQREVITKQASQGALRPTQVPKGEKSFGELSLEEMENKLGGIRR